MVTKYRPYWLSQPGAIVVGAGATGVMGNPLFFSVPEDMIIDFVSLAGMQNSMDNLTFRFGVQGKPWFTDYFFSVPAVHNIVRQISTTRGGMKFRSSYYMPHGENITLRFNNSVGLAIDMDVVFEAYRESNSRPYFLSQRINPAAVAGWTTWGGLSLNNQSGETVRIEAIWFSLRVGSAAIAPIFDQLIIETSALSGPWMSTYSQGIPFYGYMKDFGIDVTIPAGPSDVAFYVPKEEYIMKKDDSFQFEFNNIGALVNVFPVVHGRIEVSDTEG